jgi:diguanylate cyclase (GGDEF)-like protein
MWNLLNPEDKWADSSCRKIRSPAFSKQSLESLHAIRRCLKVDTEEYCMISIKKYLNAIHLTAEDIDTESNELSSTGLKCYRAVLSAFGKAAVQISPALGENLATRLRGLEQRLSFDVSPKSLAVTAKHVEAQLHEWGSQTSQQITAQTDSVKELLIALATTAESVGRRDQGYSSKFKNLTVNFEKIGDLNDLSQIRKSLVQSVTELRGSVEQMTRESRELVAHLQSEISIYETRLKSAEQLAFKDELTGLANRRAIEDRIQWNIVNHQEFCILVVDLNRFKQVNDKHGHLVGDDLIKQFAMELQSNTRAGDLVGRWGGDEFVVILMCNAQGAKAATQKIRDWVFGKYTIQGAGKSPLVLEVDAAIGVAEWIKGKDLQQLIDEADAAMYLDKTRTKQ